MKKPTKSTVLIVDDKPANIVALESLLESTDRILLSATNGKDALTTTLNKDIDLIILDVQMPEMDGFEVAQILKSNKRTKDIPIIFASAEKKEHKFMMKGYEEGAFDYFFKPLDPEVVKAKVSVLLRVELQKKELIEKNLSLEKAALLINNSADIIGIIDATTFKIEEINNSFTTILGYGIEEAQEATLTFFLSNEDRIVVQKLSKQPKEQLSFETRIYCKDRSIKWLQWNIVVKYGKWFANARDITEIKQVEKIRNYVATVVKQSNDAIYIHDDEGKIISWNEGAEEIYGYSEKEVIKMNVWNIVPEYKRAETEEFMNKVFAGEKIQDVEAKRITKHGKLIDVLFSASMVIDERTERKSIAINERDITEQKIADEKIKQLNTDLQNNVIQLELSNKELESFSYSVSHDLRAPLRAINGYTKMIEDDYSGKMDEGEKKLFENIRLNSEKMGVLIDDLLSFSRLGKKPIQKSQINTKEMVENVLKEIKQSTAHHASIKIHELFPADGDPALLIQAWTNLISNAIKYSSKKKQPEVEIGSIETGEEIIYYVKDNGAGFDMKYVEKLFGVFQRLHGPSEFEGTGVGLAIVYRIITKHGGRIWADAKINEGATFYFTISAKSQIQK
jgi:PAS domain S-box-containing protein